MASSISAVASEAPGPAVPGARSLVAALALGVLAAAAVAPVLGGAVSDQLHDGQRLVQLAVLTVVGVAWACSRQARRDVAEEASRLPLLGRGALLAAVALGVASALGAAFPSYALVEVGLYLLLGIAAVVVAAAARRHPAWAVGAITWAVVATIVLYAVALGVVEASALAVPGSLRWPDGFNGFDNVRHFNHVQTWTLPLSVLPLCAWKLSRLQRAGVIGLSGLWWCLLIVSGGRGTFVGVLAGAGIVAVLAGRQSYVWLGALLKSAGVGATLAFGWRVLPALLGLTEARVPLLRSGSSGRLSIWASALEHSLQEPWLGAGPMHLAGTRSFLVDARVAHPHNALLQSGAEWGWPATVLLVGVGVWGAVAWGRQVRSASRSPRAGGRLNVRVALTAAVYAAAVDAMVSGTLVMPASQLWGVAVVGLVLGLRQSAEPAQASRTSGVALASAAFVAACATWSGVAEDVPTLRERDERYVRSGEVHVPMPRLWRHGAIGGVLDGPPTASPARGRTTGGPGV